MNKAQRSKFQIEGGAEYSGYTLGSRWNGWDCPYFTLRTAKKIMKDLNDNSEYFEVMKYFKDDKTFSIQFPEDDEADIINPEKIQFGKKSITVYGIGTNAWIWTDVRDN